jgi:hypothetical protein
METYVEKIINISQEQIPIDTVSFLWGVINRFGKKEQSQHLHKTIGYLSEWKTVSCGLASITGSRFILHAITYFVEDLNNVRIIKTFFFLFMIVDICLIFNRIILRNFFRRDPNSMIFFSARKNIFFPYES